MFCPIGRHSGLALGQKQPTARGRGQLQWRHRQYSIGIYTYGLYHTKKTLSRAFSQKTLTACRFPLPLRHLWLILMALGQNYFLPLEALSVDVASNGK